MMRYSKKTTLARKRNIKAANAIFITLLFIVCSLSSCIHDDSFIKSLSSDITTHGFLNDDCFQSIITANPDPGIEGLVAGRESAHIHLMKSIEHKSLEHIMTALHQLGNRWAADESYHECIRQQLKPLVARRVVVATYYNHDHSKTAVVRIYEKGLKNKLASLQCK